MEAKKPHNLLTRKARGIIQFESKAMRTTGGQGWGHCWFISWTPKTLESRAPMSQGRRRWTFQLKKRESKCILSQPLGSIGSFHGLHDTMHIGACISLSLLSQMLTSSRNALTNTSRNSALPALWASLHSAKLMHKLYIQELILPINP